jgi:hypothetical protein
MQPPPPALSSPRPLQSFSSSSSTYNPIPPPASPSSSPRGPDGSVVDYVPFSPSAFSLSSRPLPSENSYVVDMSSDASTLFGGPPLYSEYGGSEGVEVNIVPPSPVVDYEDYGAELSQYLSAAPSMVTTDELIGRRVLRFEDGSQT